MKILHVSMGLPPLRVGGLTRYCYDLMVQQQRMGHEVELIYPAHFTITGKTHIRRKKEQNFIVHKIINPLPMALVFGVNAPERYLKKCNTNCYEIFFEENRPDVIHIHSLMGIHKEFFDIAHNRNIKTVFTTHDYYPFCLKCNFQYTNGQLCLEHDAKKCMDCNSNKGLSRIMEISMQSNSYKYFKYSKILTNLRNRKREQITTNYKTNKKDSHIEGKTLQSYQELSDYYKSIIANIDIIHGNSKLTSKLYNKYLPNGTHITIPVTHSLLPEKRNIDKKRIPGKLRIGFLGGARKEKGLDILVRALEVINKERIQFDLVLWGAAYNCKNIEKVKVINMGIYNPLEIETVFSTFDVLVVPSTGLETFGYVVLEALTCNTIVICSDRVGASMLLEGMPFDMVYESENIDSLVHIIDQVSSLDVFNNLLSYIKELDLNSSIVKHTNNILKMYREKL